MPIRPQTEDDDIRSGIPEEPSHFRLIFPHTLIDGEGGIGKEEMCRRNLCLHEERLPDETLVTVFVIGKHISFVNEEDEHFAPIDLLRRTKSRVDITWRGTAGKTNRAAAIFRDGALHCLSQSKGGKIHELLFGFGL